MIGALGFASPVLLFALLALPVLWVILRAVPPAPVRRLFPGVVLLLGLKDNENVTDRTPWWLLLLRIITVAAVIIGLAGPILNPSQKVTGQGPLLVLMDGSWASAQSWSARLEYLDATLSKASRDERPVAVVRLGSTQPPVFQNAARLRARIASAVPYSWTPSAISMAQFATNIADLKFETLWMSDGLARDGRAALLATLERAGPVRVFETARPVLGLAPVIVENGILEISARRDRHGMATDIIVEAYGLDPAGTSRVLATLPLTFATDQTETSGALALPAELRARVTRFVIKSTLSAGAVVLSDDSLRRREVALIAGGDNREGLELLSPLHYLNRALAPTADILTGSLTDILPANPDAVILADVATITDGEQTALLDWIDNGGLLVRFSGPRLAASKISRSEEHPLMPVRLRSGGRSVGGAMSWGAPKSLAPFTASSPFFGLSVPEDVAISAQVVAQPDPTLAARVIAQLTDGTPLVTRKNHGNGQIILFHVTANAEWSNLPLSGLFVEMLSRLAVSSSTGTPDVTEIFDTIWQPLQVLNGFGAVQGSSNLGGVSGQDLINGTLGPTLRPGIYQGPERAIARNVLAADTILAPTTWPTNIAVLGPTQTPETPLVGALLALALFLLALDVIASLALSGKLLLSPAAAVLVALFLFPYDLNAQSGNDQAAVNATAELVLAHVITGDRTLDQTAQAGLLGLSETLYFRTSVEPATPVGVNIETDEISFYPLLYWPITPNQPRPSEAAYAKLNRYLHSGGMILFDTRDSDVARFGGASANGRKLQQLAAPLDIPQLEPIPKDHVLTRAFYLLQDFPGRFAGSDVWVEAAPPDAEKIDGMPFRNLNDGVTPVVIGGNDWASAWAIDASGNRMFPVGRGYAGERQREIAYRFGINLVLHVLSGNYKSDQVHVPALLERLGQ